MDTVVITKNLSEKEKEELLKEVLGEKYSSAGKNLPVLKKAIDIIGNVSDVLTVAELIPIINTLLSSSRFFSIVSSGASVFSIFLFPVATMISIIDAYQTGHKMYAFRAIAYTLTAWAFDKTIPVSSNRVLSNLRSGDLVRRQRIVQEYKQIWAKTSQSVLTKVNTELAAKNIPKIAMQIALRALSDNNEQNLCELLMKGFESEMSHIAVLTWKSNYSIKYPS